jgi:hypothetical protein
VIPLVFIVLSGQFFIGRLEQSEEDRPARLLDPVLLGIVTIEDPHRGIGSATRVHRLPVPFLDLCGVLDAMGPIDTESELGVKYTALVSGQGRSGRIVTPPPGGFLP